MTGQIEAAREDHPIVTFALFAYNQEKYIREAVEGAFAQTYEPLEIILSDDCSSDRTFEIMQEMAAAYEGPHRVLVRRNRFNIGTALHVQSAFFDSQGVLFFVAGGDDISSPQRVEKVYHSWRSLGKPSGLLHSGYDIFKDGDSTNITRVFPKLGNCKDAISGYAQSEWLPAAAPTCAYTREVFECFPPLQGGSIIEDMPLFFRSALIGSIVPIRDSLVKLRKHENNSGSGYRKSEPARWNRFIQSKIIAFRTMQIDLRLKRHILCGDLALKIERNIYNSISGSSKLFIYEYKKFGLFNIIIFIIRIMSSKTVSKSLKRRLIVALDFSEIDYSFFKKTYRNFYKKCR